MLPYARDVSEIRPKTPEERDAARKALEMVDRHREERSAARGGKPWEPSWSALFEESRREADADEDSDVGDEAP